MKKDLMPVSIAFLCGTVLGSKSEDVILQPLFWVGAIIIFTAAYLTAGKKGMLGGLVILASVFVSGAAYYEARNTYPSDHIKFLVNSSGARHVIRGEVASNPVFKKSVIYYPELDLILNVKAISSGDTWVKTRGLVKVQAKYEKGLKLEFGQEVSVNCVLSGTGAITERDGFDYGRYLEGKRIFAVAKAESDGQIQIVGARADIPARLTRALYSLKNSAKKEILAQMPNPYAGIVIAMVLGDREFLDRQTRMYFVDTGTMHIIAISGLHMALLAVIFIGFFRMLKCPAKAAYALSAVCLVLYSVMIGDGASVWRSTIMAVIFMAGFVIDRQASVKNSFGLSLMILLAVDPDYIQDVGFILSYLCVAALIWLHPVLMNMYFPRKHMFDETFQNQSGMAAMRRKYFLEPLILSAGVWITVLPVIAYYFGTITPSIVFANLFAVPLSFLIIILGIAGLAGGFLMPILGRSIFAALDLVCRTLVWLTKGFSGILFSHVNVEKFPQTLVIVYYFALIIIFLYLSRRQKTEAERSNNNGG